MSKELSENLKIELAKTYARDPNITKKDIVDIVDAVSTFEYTASDLIASHTSLPNLKNVTENTQALLLEIVSNSSEFSTEEKQSYAQIFAQPSATQEASGSKVKI